MAVSVSGVLQSYTYTYIYSLSDSFPIQVIKEHWVEISVLYSRSLLIIYFIYCSVYPSPPPFPLWDTPWELSPEEAGPVLDKVVPTPVCMCIIYTVGGLETQALYLSLLPLNQHFCDKQFFNHFLILCNISQLKETAFIS